MFNEFSNIDFHFHEKRGCFINYVVSFPAIGFLTPLKDISTVEGTKSVLEAKISAPDITSVKWFQNDKLVTASDRVQMVVKGAKQRLAINRTYASDEGQYKLIAGKVDSTCKLSVQRECHLKLFQYISFRF